MTNYEITVFMEYGNTLTVKMRSTYSAQALAQSINDNLCSDAFITIGSQVIRSQDVQRVSVSIAGYA